MPERERVDTIADSASTSLNVNPLLDREVRRRDLGAAADLAALDPAGSEDGGSSVISARAG
jgi:hypothetical protein